MSTSLKRLVVIIRKMAASTTPAPSYLAPEARADAVGGVGDAVGDEVGDAVGDGVGVYVGEMEVSVGVTGVGEGGGAVGEAVTVGRGSVGEGSTNATA